MNQFQGQLKRSTVAIQAIDANRCVAFDSHSCQHQIMSTVVHVDRDILGAVHSDSDDGRRSAAGNSL
jgi:hypothetical protein